MSRRHNFQNSNSSSDDENYENASSILPDSATRNDPIITKLIEQQGGLSIKEEQQDSDDENKNVFHDAKDDAVDDESRKDYEKTLSAEQLLANKERGNELKSEGNTQFKNEEYTDSVKTYSEGLKICPLDCANERSILYGNRAAAHIQLNNKQIAIEDCSKSLELNPNYIKVLIRRAKLYEETEKLDESLEDYRKILEMDTSNTEARQAIHRLPQKIEERNEKLKTEMLGKLKDLGNMILKPFGLSTNNFQMQQDPSSGSYSVNFNQNANK